MGRADWLEQDPDVPALRKMGGTVFALTVDGTPAAVFVVGDPVRPGAAEALRALRAEGVSLRLLTGDHPETARAVAATLGLAESEVEAGLLPEDKAARVTALAS